jgi:2-amino-4-hydroxy-6-hydroxymethyldihydropteridine diphosphokinase
MRYFLGLGSNLGNRRFNLSLALASLKKAKVKVLRSSSLYRTQPVGCSAQPWFYNQVVEVSADLEPAELLSVIKKAERELGRQPAPKNRPRIIDIDILLAEGRVVATKSLTIPHPRMAERNFVLVPLFEIAPEAVHPLLEEPVSELCRRSRDKSRVIRMPKAAGRFCSKEIKCP